MECYLPFHRPHRRAKHRECWRADTGRFTGISGYLRAVLALAKRPSLLRHTGLSATPPSGKRSQGRNTKTNCRFTRERVAGDLGHGRFKELAGAEWSGLTFGMMVFAGALGTVR
jgi:hypothetical protein